MKRETLGPKVVRPARDIDQRINAAMFFNN